MRRFSPMQIEVRPPFDGELLLTWLAARAIPGVESVGEGVFIRGRTRVTYANGVLQTNQNAAHVRRLFDVATDPIDFTRALGHDATLGPLLRRRPGIRVPGAWDVFELCVRAIVGQQVSVAGARTVLGKLAAKHGLTPDGLAEADIEGMPRKRADTLRTLARAIASGAIDPTCDDLTQLPGIGPWTASYIRMRLGDRDAFPAGDLVLRRKAGDLSERALLAKAEAWKPFRAYAAMLLWTG